MTEKPRINSKSKSLARDKFMKMTQNGVKFGEATEDRLLALGKFS